MTRCSPTCQLLQHLRRVQQVHVLADACCALELIDLQPCLAGTSAVSCITGTVTPKRIVRVGRPGYHCLDNHSKPCEYEVLKLCVCVPYTCEFSTPSQLSRCQVCTAELYVLTDKAAEATRLILDVRHSLLLPFTVRQAASGLIETVPEKVCMLTVGAGRQADFWSQQQE